MSVTSGYLVNFVPYTKSPNGPKWLHHLECIQHLNGNTIDKVWIEFWWNKFIIFKNMLWEFARSCSLVCTYYKENIRAMETTNCRGKNVSEWIINILVTYLLKPLLWDVCVYVSDLMCMQRQADRVNNGWSCKQEEESSWALWVSVCMFVCLYLSCRFCATRHTVKTDG